ncbi:choice-of-anchor D domain-containing protein [Roseibium sediminicola]|uniref:Choice-of-anchor D domain-containing protein n=1 Tax=Roseibium sediminicola TaxID=2933272 RepID=A0ABT0GVZ0_9HYPH|nr:choice-of-anchor D domain-containing protein [Roseibium sp. CAU 1639]MCK7613612.1 choice-of-anchor D domain-containing protein [Roseibium sp. CAU 1639]
MIWPGYRFWSVLIVRTLLTVIAAALTLSVFDLQSARAAWDDCSSLSVTTGGDLTLDITNDTCSTTAVVDGTFDYINFAPGSGSSVTIDLIGIDDPSGEFSSISIAHDGGTTNVSDGTSFGQANDFSGVFNCSSGCTVSGNYDAAPISGPFSVTYTQNAGSGSVASAAPEISVSADIGGAVSDGGTNAQGTQTAGSTVTVTYTVTNSGTADLTIATATSSSLSNVTVDSIGAPGSTTVTSGGGTTTFQVQYTPTLAGAFSFGLSFTNDDSDENPFNFTVSGTATGTPEISVSADVGGAVADGGTNAQGTQTAGSTVTVTYTVTNSGTDDLTIATATSSSLSNVTVDSIGAPGSTTVTAGGGTTTFQVQYTPTIAGAFSFGLSFVNDDSDENPFNFTVSGTATGAPEISVSADIGGAVSDGGTNAQGSQAAGSTVTVTYTVTNSGTDDLTIATATSSSLSNVTVDSIGAPGSTTVAPSGGTTTFQVQYTPTLSGAFSFDLSFTNDDSDENPFNFTVSGTGTGTPEISVSADIGGAVTDGGTNAQGTQTAGSTVTVTYTVTNSGLGDLTIATATSSSLSNVTVDSIGAPGSTTVTGGGGTTTFQVQYTPTLAGAFSFDLSFSNDDSDENPFNFTVSGTATGAPEISVSADIGGAVTDGSTNAQGSQTAGSAVTVTYTVTNSGTGDLTLATATSSSLSNVTVDSIGAPGSTTVTGGGGTTTFQVQYTPTLAGAFSFGLSFVNNDGDENPFNFTVSGTGTGTPEISVSADIGGAVTDGGTNAQGTQVSGSTTTVTYTVTNSGTDDLTIATATSNTLSNVTVNSISAPGSTTVTAGGGTTTFAVQYTPSAAGAFSFNLTFVNDDADENPFNFTVSGTATAVPVFTQAFAPSTIVIGGTSTVTFTIDNSANGSAATSLDFTDNLPSGVTVATPANASTTCTGGTITAVSSSGVISYTGGTVGSGATCTVAADVTASSDGAYVNTTGDLTSSLGNSGTSSDTLTVSSPEIDVQRPAGTSIADGGTDSQGSVVAGVQQTLTYTIENTGTATLTITGTPTSTAASNVSVDTISAPGSSSLAGSATTTFTVQYTPTAAGAFSFELDIVSDDADEGTYDILVSGTALGPAEIDVQRPAGTSIADGGTDSQGTVTFGVQQTLTYTIENLGGATLTLTGTPTSAAASNVSVDSISAPGSSSLAGSATTTFTVQYTPTAAGAFSFQLDIVSDDADEGTYDILVSGTASGVAEIEVSSSESGAITDGGTDSVSGTVAAGSSATITYTITNSGTGALSVTTPTVGANVTSTTNATVNSFALSSTTVASGGGTATLEVDYTPTAAGAFGFDFNFVNDDTDENPFNITVSGTAASSASGLAVTSGSGQSTEINTQFSEVLVATVTDGSNNGVAGVSVTFTAPASGASLTFAGSGTNTETVTTGSDGTATSSAMTANSTASSYDRGALTAYSVSASAAGLTSVSFSLTNERDAEADIQKTKEVIASFVTNRANAIVSGQPDIVSRLTNGPFGGQRGQNGFNFNVTPYSQSGDFQFSMRAFMNSLQSGSRSGEGDEDTGAAGLATADRYAAFDSFSSTGTMSYTAVAAPVAAEDALAILSGTNGAAPTAGGQDGGHGGSPQSGWDFWAQGTFAITDNNSSNSHTGLLFAGVDYRYKDRAVFGLLGQLDITEETNGAANTSANGVGWMAGPYAALRVHQNFYLDGLATYGQSYNTVNALGLFEDDFRTQRFLLQGGLTGDFKLTETTRVSPFARITYYYEEQDSYTDTLGRLIPSQDFDLGRLEFGPKVTWDLVLDDRLLFSPFLSLSGIYDFNKLQDDLPTDATLASSDEDLRARLEAGAGLLIPGRGIRISGEGFFDGIGTDDFRSYGATVNVTIPF